MHSPSAAEGGPGALDGLKVLANVSHGPRASFTIYTSAPWGRPCPLQVCPVASCSVRSRSCGHLLRPPSLTSAAGPEEL